MQLTVTYRNNERRIVSLDPTFFSTTEVFERRERVTLTASDKAMYLANSLGRDPYHIVLMRGNYPILQHTNKHNKPYERNGTPFTTDNLLTNVKDPKTKKKLLRNAHKNEQFTRYIIPGVGIVPIQKKAELQ